MIYETKTHKCFLCENKLTDKYILWNKHNQAHKGTIIINDGKMIHGKTVICEHCYLVQEYEPMTEECLKEYYETKYRKLYPYPEKQGREHDRNAINILSENNLISKSDNILIVGEYSSEWNDFPLITKMEHNLKDNYSILFDKIICLNTLEHVYNPISFLKLLGSLLTHNGYIYITVPNLLSKTINLSRDDWFSNNHIYHFTKSSLISCCNKAGLKVEHIFEFTESFGDKIGIVLKAHEFKDNPFWLTRYTNLCENLYKLLHKE